jgi:Ion channel regulatory protein UNC-93
MADEVSGIGDSEPPVDSKNVYQKNADDNEHINTTSAMQEDKKPDHKKERRRIMKNIILISVAFLFNFNAFQGLSRLQSSLHRDEGMGVITSSVLYAALVLSCMFVPKLLIYAIGHRWTIALSFSGYILWMAANGYAVWGTMITASILVGLCAAPLWTAQCSYFTIIAGRYAKLNGEREEAVVTRFFGIFFMFFQLCKSNV